MHLRLFRDRGIKIIKEGLQTVILNAQRRMLRNIVKYQCYPSSILYILMFNLYIVNMAECTKLPDLIYLYSGPYYL